MMKTTYIQRLFATSMLAVAALITASAFDVDGISYNPISDTEVEVTGGEIKEEIIFPETVTYDDVTYTVVRIADGAFSGRYDSSNFTRRYVIPGTVKRIGNSAFYDNYYLEEVVLNEGLETIGTSAFEYTNIKEIRIPSTVTFIDNLAFHNVSATYDIYCYARLPQINDDPFNDCRSLSTLHVLAEDLALFQASDYWSQFKAIQTLEMSYLRKPQFSFDKDNYSLSIYGNNGATIHYTTDGTEPTSSSPVYTSPLLFAKNGTVKAMSVKDGMDNSVVSEYTRTDFQVAEPTCSIDDETLLVTFNVSDIKDIEGFPTTNIYYIADNQEGWSYETIAQGRTDWILWDGNPIQLTVPRWFHVYATRDGWIDSGNSWRTDYYSNYSTATPWYEWLREKGKLRLYNYDSDATVYYTLDGSEPTKDSEVYNPDDSITIDHNVTVKWVAMRAKHCNSEIGSVTITDATTKFVMNGISYRRIDNNVKNEVEVTSNVNDSRKYTGHVEIPAEITYAGVKYAVTRIGEGAFYDCDALEGVTIPTTVTSIGRMAFYDCNALATVDIPASVETIEYQSFRYCSSLRSVTLHEGLKTLGDGVFADDGALHQMTLPNSLETIGTDLFVRSALSGTIVIPDALPSIPARTFYECSSLKSVIIGDGVKSIDENAFRSCTSLESVTFGSGINTIAYEAFYGCSSLLSIDLQEGLTSMDTRAFYACSKLTTVSLPTTLTTIGEYAFQSCQSLTTIRLPEGVRSIGRHAFNSTPALKSIYALPATPPAMVSDAHAFQDHLGTATLYVKSSAKDVYESDANWCQFDNIQAFDNIPTTQPAFTFDRNTYLLTITSRDTGASIYYTRDNSEPTTESTRYTEPIALMQNDTVKAIAIAEGMTTSVVSEFMLNNFTTPQPVATMSEDFVVNITCETPAIDGFPETRIYYLINDSYYEVYDGWQLYDGNPIQLTQPKYVHVYAERDGWITPTQTYYDFYNSYYTRYADIGWDSEKQKAYLYNYPEGATVYYTIDGSDPTTESSVYNPTDSIAIARNLIVKALVTLPGRFPSVITSSTITGVNQTFLKDGIYYRLIDNTLANEVETTRGDKNYTGDIVVPETVTYLGTEYEVTRIGENTFTTGYYNNSQVTSVTLPSSVKSIGQYAFALMNLINEIDIPSSVKTIEYGAFQETNLSKVTFHDGLETIGEHAFYNSNRIQSLTFPSTLKSIGVEAFYNVDGIKSIVFPESVTEIGTSAFWECSSLSSVTLPSGLTKLSDGVFQTTPLQNITIPEGVTSIGYRAFYACASLSSVTIPSSVTAISNEAFYGCTALLSVSIPEGVTTIAERTFQDCTSLTTVSLPSSLTSIATYAFYNCKALPSILLPEQLKSIDTYAFGACEVMTDVYSAALTPPTLSGNANTHAFAGVVTNGTLHTKAEAKELYDNAQNWGSFSKSVGFEQVLAAQPTFVLDNYRLSMATTTAGATIRYTRDGTEPNAESAVYESPLPFMQNDTVRAVAFADGYAQSLVAEFRKADYTVPTPTVTIDDETFVVTLHSAAPDIDGFPETKYYFQINGDYYNYDEYTSSNWHLLEGDTIHLSAPRYIHVFAKRDGWQNSSKVTSNFYSNYYLYSPYIYTDRDKRAVWIKHHDYDNGPSEIYYTLDGSTPSKENGTLYTDTIFIERSLTVKAVTVQDKHFNSDVSSADVSVSTTTFLADGIYYRLKDQTLNDEVEVTGVPTGVPNYSGSIAIPATVTYNNKVYDVVSIYQGAFQSSSITAVALPASLKTIGDNAFYDARSLAAVDVPASVEQIGEHAFYNCTKLSQVKLHDGLKCIGNEAFQYCTSLDGISLPTTLTTTGTGLFYGCSALTSIVWPSSLTTIERNMFRDCSSLKSITIPATVTAINSLAFSQCRSMQSITLPEALASLGGEAFTYCSALTSITIPNGVKTIESGTFYYCTALVSVQLPAQLTALGYDAFYSCSSLVSITLPASLTSIDSRTFSGCSSLASIYALPSTPPTANSGGGLTDVKDKATLYVEPAAEQAYKDAPYWAQFANRSTFTEIAAEQPTFVFQNYKLSMATITPNGKIYYTRDGSEPTTQSLEYTDPLVFTQNDTVRAITVAEGMGNSLIAEYKKSDFKVAQPQSKIDEETFQVTITCQTPEAEGMPETRIWYVVSDNYYTPDANQYVLYDGKPIQLEQPSYVHVYGERDGWLKSDTRYDNFYSNYRVAEPTISYDRSTYTITITQSNADSIMYTLDGSLPSKDNGIKYTAPFVMKRDQVVKAVALKDKCFNSTVASRTVTGVDSRFMANGVYFRLVDNTTDDVAEVTSGSTATGNIAIPEKVTHPDGTVYTVTRVGDDAFYNNSSITGITLPSTVTSIGRRAFYNSSNLTDINWPEGLTEIGASAFRGAPITKAVIPAGVNTISEYAFYGCDKLTELTINAGVKEIGGYAFYDCSSIASLTVPVGVTTIGEYAFYGLAISEANLPATVKEIGSYAFASCKNLMTVVIPEGVTVINERTFSGCTALKSVSMPTTLTSIASYAFNGCTALESIILPENVTNMSSRAFYGNTNLMHIYAQPVNPPTVDKDNPPFPEVVVTNATLYVKEASFTAYQTAGHWGSFDPRIVTFVNLPCEQPVFAFADYKLTMTSQTEGVSIYYTTDGTEPTTSSTLYKEPVPIAKNDTILAMAIGENWGRSLTSTWKKDDYQVAAPEATITSDFRVVLSCEEPKVEGLPKTRFYYNLNRTRNSAGTDWLLYTDTLQLTSAYYMHVRAERDGWQNSQQSHFDFYTDYYVQAPTFPTTRMPADSTITISHSDADAKIYYTIDGSDPKVNGILYTQPFNPNRNATVKAIARREGRIASDEASTVESWFTVATPQIAVEHLAAVITAERPAKTTIYYTTDGKTPTTESTVYTGPVALSAANTTVRALAVADDWNDSSVGSYSFRVADFTVATPQFSPVSSSRVSENADSTLTIKSSTEDAIIYYTIDGSEPTIQSLKYDGPVKLTHNSSVKAMAVKADMFNSSVSETTVAWFNVKTPVITFNGKYASMASETDDVAIYYTIDNSEPTTKSTPYTTPFVLPAEQTYVKAIAVRENWNNSSVAERTYNQGNNYCEAPTITQISGTDQVQMATRTEGATIYYTTDGTLPTTSSLVYDGKPITMTHNLTLTAMATQPILYDSETTAFKVDWFKVDRPVISNDGINVTISCAKQGARIYYTTNGSTPTTDSQVYTSALVMTGDCMVKTMATYDNFNQSAVDSLSFSKAENTAAAPTYSRDGNSITLASASGDGTIIYYTTDDSEPTTASDVYTEPVTVTENQTLKALAVNPKLFTSTVSSYTVDWFKAETPVIAFDGITMSISCATPQTTIYYTLDNTKPTEESLRYTSPVAMTGTCTVKAIALRDNFNPSTVGSEVFETSRYTAAAPTFSRNGNVMTLATTTAGSTIYYTTDGSTPTTSSQVYTEPVTVGENQVLQAMTVNPKLFTSDVTSYRVDWFKVDVPVIAFDGITMSISCATEQSTIYYTTDGTLPDANSLTYTAPVVMTGTCTVKAIGMRTNFDESDLASQRFEQSQYTTAAPTFSRSGNTVTLATTTEGSTIYYTLDNTEPSVSSEVYSEPIEMTENCTLRTLATNPKLFSSAESSYTVNWFKVDAPEVVYDGIFVTMSSTTPNARIYYTLDGTTPTEESLRYTGQLTMSGDCTVKAIGLRDNFNASSVVTSQFDKALNTVVTPQVSRSGNVVSITTATTADGTVIRYTTDGSEPTADSRLYEGSIEVGENQTVKALAMNPKLFTSDVAVFEVDWFKVATPVLTLSGSTLTMSCATADATIHYSIGQEQPTAESPVYSGALQLTDNRPVQAIAVRKNFHNSEVERAEPDYFVCDAVTFGYNGRYLTMSAPEGQTIHYTLDGSRPTEDSEVYGGEVAIDELCTVKAVAMRRDFRSSQETEYKVSYVYNGEEVSLDEAGHLEEVFAWTGGAQNIQSLPVQGNINAKDLQFIQSLQNLKHLDLTNATFEGDALPDEAFAGLPLLSFSSPKQLKSVGEHLFKGCTQLGAIVWNANMAVPENVIDDVKGNPNFLLYVNSRIHVPSNYSGNVVSGGQATSITLSDAPGAANFCCPQSFYTQRISYTHSYTQPTESGVTCGWETLALPFDVQTITHERRGALAPFGAGQDITAFKPFWLYELKETGFAEAGEVKAYTPYIISMPNNPDYADDYILAGRVTFSAADTYVQADTAFTTVKGSVQFAPAMQRQQQSASVLAINLEDYTDQDGVFYRSGSAFLPNMRAVSPFEAYALVGASAPKLLLGDLLWGSLTDMRNAQMTELVRLGRKAGVYDLSGRKLSTDSESLQKNSKKMKRVYIVNGKKTVVE